MSSGSVMIRPRWIASWLIYPKRSRLPISPHVDLVLDSYSDNKLCCCFAVWSLLDFEIESSGVVVTVLLCVWVNFFFLLIQEGNYACSSFKPLSIYKLHHNITYAATHYDLCTHWRHLSYLQRNCLNRVWSGRKKETELDLRRSTTTMDLRDVEWGNSTWRISIWISDYVVLYSVKNFWNVTRD